MEKLFKILGIGFGVLIILYIIWLFLPYRINRHSDIKLGNRIISQIEEYRKVHGLPESNDWETLKKFDFINHLDFLEPEYQKINDNEYQLIFIEGFDGPYLLWNSIEKEWKIAQPKYPDSWNEKYKKKLKLSYRIIPENKNSYSIEWKDTLGQNNGYFRDSANWIKRPNEIWCVITNENLDTLGYYKGLSTAQSFSYFQTKDSIVVLNFMIGINIFSDFYEQKFQNEKDSRKMNKDILKTMDSVIVFEPIKIDLKSEIRKEKKIILKEK